MLSYYQPVSDGESVCSVDMVRLKLDFSGEKYINAFGKWLSHPQHMYVEQYPVSFKSYAFRNLFQVTCRNSCSFVVGLSFNGSDKDSFYLGFMEFNPNKVADQEEFQSVMYKIREFCFHAKVVRWDLAVDVPERRDMCVLCKDKRSADRYHVHWNSEIDKTEYLGQRNRPGFVKLYNKTIESGLDHDLTRLEITVAGDMDYGDFVKILPRIIVKGDQQTLNPFLDPELNRTDLVLYQSLMYNDVSVRQSLIKGLGYVKRKKLRPYLEQPVFDSDKFVVSGEAYRQLRLQLRQWTVGIRYGLREDLADY